MAKSFDANRTWDEAVRMLKANRELILVLAGLFFFLPMLAAVAFFPEIATGPTEVDADDPVATLRAYLERNAAVLIALQVLQLIGVLSILALLAKRRPTVAEAIKVALTAFLPVVLAQILLAMVSVVAISIMVAMFSFAGPLGVTMGLAIAVVIAFYLFARFSPLLPIFVFDQVRNPLSGIASSWRLTKGRGGRLLSFLALIFVAMIVVSLVVGLVATLISSLMGDHGGAIFVAGGINAALGALIQAVMAGVLAAIYRQLNARSEPPSALAPRG